MDREKCEMILERVVFGVSNGWEPENLEKFLFGLEDLWEQSGRSQRAGELKTLVFQHFYPGLKAY